MNCIGIAGDHPLCQRCGADRISIAKRSIRLLKQVSALREKTVPPRTEQQLLSYDRDTDTLITIQLVLVRSIGWALSGLIASLVVDRAHDQHSYSPVAGNLPF